MPPDLAIIVVNYNVRDLLRACLRSIARSTARDTSASAVQVWVVDNGSDDGSAAMVREEFPWVTVREPRQNVGFARGNNLALREILRASTETGLPRYVLLLNPDTELPPTALERMVAFLEARPDAGAAGPRLIRADGSLDLACRRSFPTPTIAFYRLTGLGRVFPRSRRFGQYNLTYLAANAVAPVDSVVGAFMLVRGELLTQVGLLDEDFFMYGEDLDWALRIKQAGWQVWYNGEVTVYHHKRASSRQQTTQSLLAFYGAMLIFFQKHYAPRTAKPIRWLVVGGIYLQAGLALARNGVRPRDIIRAAGVA